MRGRIDVDPRVKLIEVLLRLCRSRSTLQLLANFRSTGATECRTFLLTAVRMVGAILHRTSSLSLYLHPVWIHLQRTLPLQLFLHLRSPRRSHPAQSRLVVPPSNSVGAHPSRRIRALGRFLLQRSMLHPHQRPNRSLRQPFCRTPCTQPLCLLHPLPNHRLLLATKKMLPTATFISWAIFGKAGMVLCEVD